MAYFNRVEILIPSALATLYDKYNTPDNTGLFSPDSLVLYTAPDGYTPILEDLGEPGFIDGYTSTTVSISAKRYGFELRTLESREVAYKMLKAIASNAASGYNYQAVRVRDYQAVDEPDESTGYTLRNMRITALAPASGSLRSLPSLNSSRFITGGFTVRLMEIQAREVW
jgi:hypothetical protein